MLGGKTDGKRAAGAERPPRPQEGLLAKVMLRLKPAAEAAPVAPSRMRAPKPGARSTGPLSKAVTAAKPKFQAPRPARPARPAAPRTVPVRAANLAPSPAPETPVPEWILHCADCGCENPAMQSNCDYCGGIVSPWD